MAETNLNNPGEIIRKEREKQGMTQEQLASKLYVSRESISNLERGQYNPTIKNLEECAKALGKEAVILLIDRNDEYPPAGQSCTTYLVKEIKPITTIEPSHSSSRRNGYFVDTLLEEISRPREARDIVALIDLWNLILESGALNNPCAGIKMQIENKEDPNDRTSIGSLVGNAVSWLSDEASAREKLFNSKVAYSIEWLIKCCHVDYELGSISLIFNPSFQYKENIKESIYKIIEKEKEKLRKAKRYLKRNPDGLHFMCYERPLDYDVTNDYIYSFEIIKAWNMEQAKMKYLEIGQEEKMYSYYCDGFLQDFIEMVLCGDSFDYLKNEKKINEIADALYERVEHRIGYIPVNDKEYDNIVKDIIEKDIKKENLLDVFGLEDFKTYWFKKAILDVGAKLPDSEINMLEYIYSAMMSRNVIHTDE